MSGALLLARLGLATLAFTVLASLLMAARRPLRARLGAEAVYALWLLVPLGVALCGWPVHREVVRMTAVAAPAPAADLLPGPAAAADAAPHAAAIVLCVWLLGAATGALLLGLRQRAFVRSLGVLHRVQDDGWVSARSDAGPMLVGLLRPRIVLPADYAARYSEQELAAVLAHERLHRRRGDLWWNALGAALRCLFWFHPLAAATQRRYLADQELACDSAVLRSRVHAPQTYANALLKTQAGAGVPFGCAMQSASPLRERILNLGRGASPRRVRMLTALLLAAAAVAGGRLAWAASAEIVVLDEAAPAPASAAFRIVTELSVDGGAVQHRERVVRGPLHLTDLRDGEGRPCDADVVPRPLADGSVDVRMQLTCDGRPAASPRLLTRPGTPATVAIGRSEVQADGSVATTRGFRLTMTLYPL